MPRLSGVISSNRKSLLFPASISACIAAPSATTSSGFTESFTGFPKKVLTDFFTKGTRVLPPTITTDSISSACKPASFSAILQQVNVRSTNGAINASNCCRLSSSLSLFHSSSKTSLFDKYIFAVSAFKRSACESCLFSTRSCWVNPAFSAQYFTMALSISSPPRNVSPLVDNTSKTPAVMRKMEMSKVPPPRSYTAISFDSFISNPIPYARLAAVGSLMIRNTSMPASFPASRVACLCVSLK